MKGTKRTSVIAIALALVLALSVLVGAGTDPTMNENGTQPVNNGQITFVVKCQHGEDVNATITGTATYTLVPSEEPEPSTEPSEQPVEPSAPAEPSTEPSEQPVEPSAPAEPSAEPSEQTVEPNAPVVEPSDPVVEPDKTITREITGASVDKATTENGYDYTLTSLKYTVTAKGYEGPPSETTVNAADIENNEIPVEMTDIAPTMSANWNLEDKAVSIRANDAKDDNAPVVVIFTKNDKIVSAIEGTNKDNPHPKDAGLGGFEVKNNTVTDDSKTKIKNAMAKEYGAVFGKGDDGSDCFMAIVNKDSQVTFGNVTNRRTQRGIIVIDSHGNVTAEVIHQLYNVTVSDADKWTAKKTATVTLNTITEENGETVALISATKATHLRVTKTSGGSQDYIYEIEISKIKDYTFTTDDIKTAGTYMISAGYYNGILLNGGGWTEVKNSRVYFTVSNIDTIAPEVTVKDEGSVINHITASASDKGGSGVASVCLAKVEFGYVQAKNDNGTDKTAVRTVDIGQNEDGTKKTQNVTVPVYRGTINGVAVGAEVTAEVEVIDGSPSIKEKDAQNTAIEKAKEFFEDNKSVLPEDVVKGVNDNKISATLDNSNGKYEFSLDALKKDFNGQSPALIIWATDNAGNVSNIAKLGAATASGKKITIDCDNPVVKSVSVANINSEGFTNSKTITVTAEIVEDHVDSVTAYLVKYGADPNTDCLNKTLSYDEKEDKYTGTIEAKDDGEYYVVVVAEDKAGNKSYTVDGEKMIPNEETAKSSAFIVDTKKPTMSHVLDPVSATLDKGYFNCERKLTATVEELHFASGTFVYKDLEAGENAAPIEDPFTVSENGSVGNFANNVFTYTFDKDGKYELVSMTLTDKAGNSNTYTFDGEPGVDTSKAKESFTVDKTAPTVKVDYSNQSPANDKYFNADRTATITVTEHNFNGEKVNIVGKDFKVNSNTASGAYIIITQNDKDAKGDARNLDIDKAWTTNGDTHTLKITYTGSVNYVFDVVVVDRAGNVSATPDYAGNKDFAPNADSDFDVDKVAPKVTITGVTNGSAYNGEVAGTVNYDDANFSSATIKLTRADKNSVYDVTAQHTTALPTAAPGGNVNLVNFDRLLTNDGIYTLTATVVDMAGNTAENTVTFSVNRFGSTYKFDDYLASICDKHIKSVTDDLKITEINPDSITSGTVTITRNGKVIDSGDIAAVLQRSGSASGGWYEYLYTISKDLFKEDGMYKIVVSSKDAAGNEPNSENDEEFEIVFWVDDTPAEIAGIQGLEDAIINAENHTVKFTVRDNIGLKSVTVYCDGKETAKFGEKDFTAGDLVDAQFTISEASSAQHIRIVAEDLSGNILDTDGTIEGSANTTVSFERDVTVSTNFFVRWFANKPLFFGSIAVIVAAGVGIYFIVAKKHKKEEATAE